ncbi:MAG TPA: hypothetical protein VGL89_17615 [Candidatus Koribacter sp.]
MAKKKQRSANAKQKSAHPQEAIDNFLPVSLGVLPRRSRKYGVQHRSDYSRRNTAKHQIADNVGPH